MKTPRHPAQGAAPARTRPVLRRLSLFLVPLAFAAFAASALAGSYAAKASYVINGSITNSDPVITNSPYSPSRAECFSGLPGPLTSPATFHYKVYSFRTLSPNSRCITVGLAVHSGTAEADGYLRPFNPSDPGSGFWASTGGLGAGQTYDFEMWDPIPAAGREWNVVVHETTQNGGATYTLLVEGVGIIMTGGGPTSADGLQSFRASSAPKGVLVRWRTRSEQDALGFNVYRGDSKKVRLTRSIVRASGDGRGHSYSYLDRSARRGKAAPYYLEVVQRGGSKIMFGPALRTAR
jgi:hypothetical protein